MRYLILASVLRARLAPGHVAFTGSCRFISRMAEIRTTEVRVQCLLNQRSQNGAAMCSKLQDCQTNAASTGEWQQLARLRVNAIAMSFDPELVLTSEP